MQGNPHLQDLRDHLDRAHGHPGQPRRHDLPAGHPAMNSAASRASSGPSTPTPYLRQSCSPRVRHWATASRRRMFASSGLGVYTLGRPSGPRPDRRSYPPCLSGARRGDRHPPDAPDAVRLSGRGLASPGAGSAGPRRRVGPMSYGAVVEGPSRQWIFWLNVPIGLVLMPPPCRPDREPTVPTTGRPARPGLLAAACSESSALRGAATATLDG